MFHRAEYREGASNPSCEEWRLARKEIHPLSLEIHTLQFLRKLLQSSDVYTHTHTHTHTLTERQSLHPYLNMPLQTLHCRTLGLTHQDSSCPSAHVVIAVPGGQSHVFVATPPYITHSRPSLADPLLFTDHPAPD